MLENYVGKTLHNIQNEIKLNRVRKHGNYFPSIVATRMRKISACFALIFVLLQKLGRCRGATEGCHAGGRRRENIFSRQEGE